ncbi:MAG: flagellar biosynthesis anti-sigma factor FlgM [Sphaerotilus natans]
MKIGNSNSLNTSAPAPVNATPSRTETPRDATPPAPQAGTPKDSPEGSSVQMSELSSTMREGAASPAEFDAEKVERMRQAVLDGTYRVNAEAIADKMLANAQDLLGQIGTGR